MKRLFFTDEKSDNRIFQRLIGFQPSYGWLLLDDMTYTYTVFLDSRYHEKEMHDHVGRTGKKVLLDKRITDILGEYLVDGEELAIEKIIPYMLVDTLRTSDLDVVWLFDEEYRQRSQRVLKSPEEQSYIRHAISLTEDIWGWISGLAMTGELVGKTEGEVRGMLVQQAFSLGLDGEAFDTIVATGVHTAIPHHQTSNKVIQPGPLLIDMGFRRRGWCSDFTRTIWVPSGRLDEKTTDAYIHFHEIRSVVQQAHDTAMKEMAHGKLFSDISRVARKVIEDAGYGDYFTHALGHGVGLDVHEAPRVSMKSSDIISPGMVFTIEPGIYIPGVHGVRRENIVIVE